MNTHKMVKENLVSVIMPAYNSEKFVGSALDSVIKQSYDNWEVIVVDDCSSDNTSEVIKKYKKMDKRIRHYKLDKNSGVATARNKALKLASGRFVAFLDSDDIWHRNKLELQLKFMLENNYGFTFTSYEMFNNDSKKTKIIKVPNMITYNQYLKNTIIGNLTVMMDQEIIGSVVIEKGYLEDVLTWMKYLKNGHNAYGLNINLARYRVTSGSVSSNKYENAKRYFICLRKTQNLSLKSSIAMQIGYIYNAIKKRI